jgi:hypothetical protein
MARVAGETFVDCIGKGMGKHDFNVPPQSETTMMPGAHIKKPD